MRGLCACYSWVCLGIDQSWSNIGQNQTNKTWWTNKYIFFSLLDYLFETDSQTARQRNTQTGSQAYCTDRQTDTLTDRLTDSLTNRPRADRSENNVLHSFIFSISALSGAPNGEHNRTLGNGICSIATKIRSFDLNIVSNGSSWGNYLFPRIVSEK